MDHEDVGFTPGMEHRRESRSASPVRGASDAYGAGSSCGAGSSGTSRPGSARGGSGRAASPTRAEVLGDVFGTNESYM